VRAALVLLAFLAPSVLAAYPVPVDDEAVAGAQAWLRARTRADGCVAADVTGACAHATTRDAILALSSTGADPTTWSTPSPINYVVGHRAELEAEVGGCPACGWAKTIVTLSASGLDPRASGDYDYVARLDAFYDGVQVGDARQINDDAWALFAYASLDEADASRVESIRLYLAARQNRGDGGWSWSLGPSEPWGTATVLLALLETGTPADDASVAQALAFLRSKVGPRGLILQEGADSAESTAIALQAVRRAGRDPTAADWVVEGHSPVDALLSLQAADGSFAHNAAGGSRFLATTQVLPALRGVPYPFRPPVLSFEAPADAAIGTATTFSAQATDPDGRIAAFEWTLDGSSVGTSETVDVRWDVPGETTVGLRVVDDDGVSRVATANVHVHPAADGTNRTVEETPVVVARASEAAKAAEGSGAAPGGASVVAVAAVAATAAWISRRHR